MQCRCWWCQELFESPTDKSRQYCSQRHANAYNYAAYIKRRTAKDIGPDVDLGDEPAIQGPQKDGYEATCLSCSRRQGDYLLTAEQARNRRLVGLPRCGTCRGLVLLEPVLMTGRTA